MMKFQFNDAQLAFQKELRTFAEQEIKPFISQLEQNQFPKEIFKKMGERGWLGIPIPETYHGMGKDFVDYIMAIHELSKKSAAVGVILSVHTSVGTNPIMYFGTEAQKEKYVTKLASGEYLGAFALTEPHAGSDAAKLSLKAVKDGDEYVMNGAKIFITNGHEADTFVTFARTEDVAGPKGISAFIIEKNTPGLTIGKNEDKMGLHGTSTVMLHFENCRVSASQLLGERGQGFKVAMANLNAGRIGIAAQALGIAEATFEYTRDYVKKIERPSQSTLFTLADMATKLEAAHLLVYQAAYKTAYQLPAVKECSMAKLFTTRVARELTIDAINLVGMDGTSEDNPLERYFREAKVTEIYEGTSEIQRIVIGKHILK